MNGTFKQFFKANIYQFIAAIITASLTLVGAYVALQLFIQSTTFKIQAITDSINDIKTTISRQEDVANKVDTINEKVQNISDRLDRQGNTINQLYQYELNRR